MNFVKFRRNIMFVFGLMMFVAMATISALANHPVLVEGNCFGDGAAQRTTVTPGTCGDYDGDGRIGTAEDTDVPFDRVFGTINAANSAAGINNNGTITIVASGTFPEIVTITDKIVEKLGIAVFSTNGELMEEVIGKLLTQNGKTLSVAESCTGGLIGERLTGVSGASGYFIEGVIAYANEAKTRTLGVSNELIETHGAVSAEVAEAMAKGIRERAKTNFGISVTGIAGPGGGSEEKPVGLVFVGYSDETQTKWLKMVLPGDRFLIRWRSSQAALDFLRRKILKKSDN